MKTLEKGKEKIKKICDILRQDTLEPAKQEAQAIIDKAKAQAEKIIEEARTEAEKLQAQARLSVEQEKNVFHSSLAQASKQCLEALKQEIERKLFNEELQQILAAHTTDPKVIARLIAAIIQAIEKEGTDVDLLAIIPKTVSVSEVNAVLGEGILKKLKDHSVAIGNIEGGAQVKLINKKMTIDISDISLKELLASYVRKDFRKLLFAS